MSSYINTILCNVLAEQERLLAGYDSQPAPYDTTSLTTTYPQTYNSYYDSEISNLFNPNYNYDFAQDYIPLTLNHPIIDWDLSSNIPETINTSEISPLPLILPQQNFSGQQFPDIMDRNTHLTNISLPNISNNTQSTTTSLPDIMDNNAQSTVASLPDIMDSNAQSSVTSLPDIMDSKPSTTTLLPDIERKTLPYQQQCITTLNNHQNQLIQTEKQVADILPQQGLQNILSQTAQIPQEESALLSHQNQK